MQMDVAWEVGALQLEVVGIPIRMLAMVYGEWATTTKAVYALVVGEMDVRDRLAWVRTVVGVQKAMNGKTVPVLPVQVASTKMRR